MHKRFVLTLCAISMAGGLLADQPNMNNSQKKQPAQMREITPQAEPVVKRWADPFITADFIYWKASQAGLGFAFNGISAYGAGAAAADATSGKVATPSFKYEPGFKLGAGLKFRHDGWDIYAQWTWLKENAGKKTIHADIAGNSVVQANFEIPYYNAGVIATDILSFPDEAEASWNMRFNTLDLEMGRNFYVSQFVTLRPFTGLKFAWTREHLNASFEGGSSYPIILVAIPDGSNFGVRNKQTQFGVGIRSGIDSVWYFAKHFGLYADFAMTALWSDLKVRQSTTIQTPASNVTTASVKQKQKVITPVLEMAIGLRYDTTCHNDDWQFMLQAGWEQQIFFDMCHFFNPNDRINENLSLQGLTIKAGFAF